MGDRSRAGQQHAEKCLHRSIWRASHNLSMGEKVWAIRVGHPLSATFRMVAGAGGGKMSRTILAAPLTLYVAPSGSDTTGDGSVGTPWATPQFAAQWLQRNIDLGDESATIHLGAGTYTSGVQVLAPFVGGNINAVAGVTFSGDTTTPGNVVIAITNGLAFQASFGAKFAVEGMKLTVAGSGDALYASAGGAIYVSGPMEFGTVPSTQNGSHMHVTVGGSIVGSADYKISGGGSIHFFA